MGPCGQEVELQDRDNRDNGFDKSFAPGTVFRRRPVHAVQQL
jgi:hypothetical protein